MKNVAENQIKDREWTILRNGPFLVIFVTVIFAIHTVAKEILIGYLSYNTGTGYHSNRTFNVFFNTKSNFFSVFGILYNVRVFVLTKYFDSQEDAQTTITNEKAMKHSKKYGRVSWHQTGAQKEELVQQLCKKVT